MLRNLKCWEMPELLHKLTFSWEGVINLMELKTAWETWAKSVEDPLIVLFLSIQIAYTAAAKDVFRQVFLRLLPLEFRRNQSITKAILPVTRFFSTMLFKIAEKKGRSENKWSWDSNWILRKLHTSSTLMPQVLSLSVVLNQCWTGSQRMTDHLWTWGPSQIILCHFWTWALLLIHPRQNLKYMNH